MHDEDDKPAAGEFYAVKPGDTLKPVGADAFSNALKTHISKNIGDEPFEEDTSNREWMNDDGEWAGGKTLMPWSEVCRLFDHKNVRLRHPGWEATMSECAIFDLSRVSDSQMRDSLDSNSFHETPMPFPSIAICMGLLTIVARDVWLDEEKIEMGGEILCFVRPHPDMPEMANVVSSTLKWVPKGDSLSTTVESVSQTDCINGSPSYIVDDVLHALSDTRQLMGWEQRCGIAEALFLLFATALSYVNAPENFVVKDSPRKLGKTKKGKTKRQHSRPRYIVLDKKAIHTRYLDSQPSGRKPTVPHLRRGHYRTLTAARYKEPGHRVWVRATHVKGNEVEWREGDRFYKVL